MGRAAGSRMDQHGRTSHPLLSTERRPTVTAILDPITLQKPAPTTTTDPAQQEDLWQRMFERHKSRLFRLAVARTGNADDAEDVVQEVFLAAFRHLDGRGPQAEPGMLGSRPEDHADQCAGGDENWTFRVGIDQCFKHGASLAPTWLQSRAGTLIWLNLPERD